MIALLLVAALLAPFLPGHVLQSRTWACCLRHDSPPGWWATLWPIVRREAIEAHERASVRTIAPGHGDYPRLGFYGAMRGDGNPFLRSDGSLDSAVCREQARFDVVVLDAAAPKLRPDIVRALRHFNPKITLLGYVMGSVYWRNDHPAIGDTSTDYPWRYYQAVRESGGLVWDTNGDVIPYAVNVSKLTTMVSVADVILADVVRPGLWDGLMIDITCSGAYALLGFGVAVDLARIGFANISELDAACRVAHRAFIERLRAGSPPGYVIVGNCGAGGERDLFSGWMRENFPWQNRSEETNEDGWVANMIGNGWGQPGYLDDDDTYTPPTLNWLVSNRAYGDSLNAENLRRNRYGLGSATLGNGVHSFARDEWELRRRWWWFPEFAVNQYGNATSNPYWKGWLGRDHGRPWRFEGVATSTNTPVLVWRRDFQRGLDLVNPTGYAVRVVPGGWWRTIRAPLPGYTGARDTAFVVPARDALFLLRAK